MFERSKITIGDAQFEVRRTDDDVLVNEKKVDFPIVTLTNRFVSVRLSDRVERFAVNRNGDDLWLIIHGRVLPLTIETERDRLLKVAAQAAAGEGGGALIKAAMPGLVVRINVAVGQTVKRGDAVLILEAMKMENVIKSPRDGKVKKVNITLKQAVEKNQVLLEFE